MTRLPPAVPKPCNDCPWRRNALPGWLGPFSADDWLQLAHSDYPIACHQTIPEGSDGSEETWLDPDIRQCAGAALFRVNIAKSPRNPTDAEHSFGVDHPLRETVFPGDNAFRLHHAGRRN